MNKIINPNWITGLIDGEGSFNVRFSASKYHKTAWYIQACFQLSLHIRDKDLVSQVKSFFNEVGSIYLIKNKAAVYQVRNLNEIINIIIPHFERYPLITQKRSDFLLFKEIVELMNKGEHLDKESLSKIVNLRASLNKGLPNKLKIAFPDTVKVDRYKFTIPINIDYNWIAGFFTGEGCFFIDIFKSRTSKTGYSIILRILVGQHSRDILLMTYLMTILNSGNLFNHSNGNAVIFTMSSFNDLYNKIIPMLHQYKIEGIKKLDFEDFCEAAEIINKKTHLTLEGLEAIRKIKFRMNRKRV